jgi:hypothetical protein
MDSSYDFYQAKVRQAEQMRRQARDAFIDASWQHATRLVGSVLHGIGNLLHGHHPLHH